MVLDIVFFNFLIYSVLFLFGCTAASPHLVCTDFFQVFSFVFAPQPCGGLLDS